MTDSWTRAMLIGFLLAGCGGGEHEDEHGHDEHEAEAGHGDARGEGVVRIDPAAVARNDIRVEAVRATVVAGGIEAPAEVQLPPDRIAHVTPIVTGQLSRVEATVGDRVREGEVLAVLQSVELGESRGALAEARANVEVARANFERQNELQAEGIGARREHLEAEAALRRAEAELAAARQRLSVYGGGGSGSSTTIRSPIEGTVLERHATVGEVVGPDEVMFVIGDPAEVWVVGRVYPQDVEHVRAGAPVRLTLQSASDRTWRGSLDYVAPALDPDSRTLPVRVVLPNEDGTLRPGLFGTLSITPAAAGAAPVPAIEADAVIRMGGRDVVFVPGDAEGEFRAIDVTTGARGGGLVEVRAGLSAGERYVADGAFVLKSELGRSELGHGHAH